MADAGQYAGAASAVYDPQAASENAAADATHANSLADLSNSESKIDPQYADAFKSAAEARASEAAKTDFSYSSALDGNMSGLHDNATIQQGNRYQDEVKKLAGEQAQAHTDIALKKNEENTSYGALRSSIASKYAGLKAGFMQDEADKQNAMDQTARLQAENEAFQQRMQSSDQAFKASQNAAAHANDANVARSDYNNELDQIKAGLDKFRASGYKTGQPGGWNDTIGQLTTKYANKGISSQEIAATVHGMYHNYGMDHLH